MAVRFLALIALCFLPALVSARPVKPDFIVEGKVYCDTCLAGFETTATTYISGAKVRVECRDVNSNKITYSCDGETNESGMYRIPITGDHEEHTCDMVLVSSPQSDCAKAVAGRDRARLALTHNNGIVSDKRYANNLSFQRHAPLAGCAQVMKQYQEYED